MSCINRDSCIPTTTTTTTPTIERTVMSEVEVMFTAVGRGSFKNVKICTNDTFPELLSKVSQAFEEQVVRMMVSGVLISDIETFWSSGWSQSTGGIMVILGSNQ